MSERLYYADSYITHFSAQIIERLPVNHLSAVVLDKTCFYPESGGQPADAGIIAGIPVQQLIIREEDEAILHLLDGEMPADDNIEAAIDWCRRFDHMQQHSGQHILSQAFWLIADVPTISFHLGAESCTIDLPNCHLTSQRITQTEQFANQIIWENRPVTAKFVPKHEIASLSLRKIPDVKGDSLRVVEIKDFDLNACGGTHVANCGEVGIIKITKVERRRDGWRVSFRCGKRALTDYAKKNEIVNQLMGDLTTGATELSANVRKLQGDLKQSRKSVKKLQRSLLTAEAEKLWGEREEIILRQRISDSRSGTTAISLISAIFPNRESGEVSQLANMLAANAGTVALLGISGKKAKLIFARAHDVRNDMNSILQQLLPLIGGGSGGGKEGFAQGGGMPATENDLQQALDDAKKLLF